MTQTLVIYEMVPEDISMYLIENEFITNEELQILNACNGKYVNLANNSEEDDQSLDCLMCAVTDDVTCLSTDHPVGSFWASRWVNHKIDYKNPPENMNITRIFRTGFLL